jgi:tetratricopeptide (TPR) repeat protein
MKKSKIWSGILSAVLCATLLSAGIAQAAYTTVKEAQAAAMEKIKAKDYVGARADLDEAMKLAQTDKEKYSVLNTVAKTYNGEKNYPAARGEFEKILALPKATPDQKLVANIGVANSYLAEKKYDAARGEFNKALALPEIAPAYKAQAIVGIGQSYAGEKNYAQARTEFTKLLTLADARPVDKVTAQLNFAQTYYYEKNYPLARTEYQKVATMEGATEAQKARADRQLKAMEGK